MLQFWHVFEVHPVDSRDGCRYCQNRRPGCEPLCHIILLHRREQQVCLEGAFEEVPHVIDALDYADNMILNITEIGPHFRRDKLDVEPDESAADLLQREDSSAHEQQLMSKLEHACDI